MDISVRKALLLFEISFSLLLSGCGSSTGDGSSAAGLNCPALTGSKWKPNVSGVSSSNHDSSVSVTKTVTRTTGPITGLGQPAPASREISVSIDMSQDLGEYGSLTLMAQVTNYPQALSGSAFAFLVSLSDGTNEYINLTRSGASGDCADRGYFTCSGGVCSVNSSCSIQWPSAYQNRDDWEIHQRASSSAINLPSINIFPTCNWSGGTNQSQLDPSCGFNSTFFVGSPSRLRSGVTYTAKYVIIADSYSSLSGYTAGLKVTAVKKSAPRASLGGAFDLNFILVGSDNIQASRTTKGKQNLNTLATYVANYFAQTNSNLKIGAVYGVEWDCEQGGDSYTDVRLDELSDLFTSSSTLIPSSRESKSINIYLVNSITDESENSNLTILGVDGAIGGPVINGTAVSGLVVSTFDMLHQYNPNCPSSSSTCGLTQQEADFFELVTTTTHEIGHFLGVRHPDEYNGQVHDPVRDTPVCTATVTIGGVNYVTITSCLTADTNIFSGTNSTCNANCGTYISVYSPSAGSFCPQALACPFNYIMWWTTKNFDPDTGTSDGNWFSPQQGLIMNYHPVVQ